jgi:hypothetical protein
MSAGASLAFPGGRTLAAWWRQLAPYRPEALWVGYLTFHRLEAPVSCQRLHKLPAFEFLVLRALDLHAGTADIGTGALQAIAAELHLDAPLVRQVVCELERAELVTLTATGTFRLSQRGRQALEHGEFVRPEPQRRTFHFWHADWPLPGALPTSRFVAFAHSDKLLWLAAPQTAFEVELLRTCIHQSQVWKERHGFPRDVVELLTVAAGAVVDRWQEVLVAYTQRLFAAVARTRKESGQTHLVAWTAQTRNWELQASQPAFVIPHEPEGWFPPPPSQECWRQAFVEWCQQRQLTVEPEHCQLVVEGQRLLVTGPGLVVDRLRVGKGTAKGETWLLAGDGTVRAAARLEFGEAIGQ